MRLTKLVLLLIFTTWTPVFGDVIHLDEKSIKTFYDDYFKSSTLDWEDINGILTKSSPQSIEEFLQLLPVRFRANYTLT